MCNYLSTLSAFAAFCALSALVSADTVSDYKLESIFGSPTSVNLTKYQGMLPVVNLNGNNNYQATQQVFFISGAPQKVSKGMKDCVTYLERDDYTVRPGIGVHKLHKRRVFWNKARKSCMEEGASLAIMNSAREEAAIMDWVRQENVGSVWLGAHDQFEEGVWITLSGEPISSVGYERWWVTDRFPNQPDNYGGNQNCATLVRDGGMDDVDCFSPNAYVCEINLC